MKDSLFLRACRGEKVERPPIWLMRQAGRYLPEYRELRNQMTMLQAVSTPEIAVEATLQPIRRFNFDAAILFSDLTITFGAMGAPFDIREGVGPVIENPVRTSEDISKLHRFSSEQELGFTLEAIKILKKELKVPLIGFTGAPFTLASYLIEGGPSRDLARTKSLMYSDPTFWHSLMELLSDVVCEYLGAQLDSGADAVQIFDSWVGHLSPPSYDEFLMPYMFRIFTYLEKYSKPVIHFGTGNPLLLTNMASAGGDVIGVDSRCSLTYASECAPGKVLQGNLDPTILLTNPDVIKRHARRIVEEGRKAPGHIFNLGHGILPSTPIENVQSLVDAVHECAVAEEPIEA